MEIMVIALLGDSKLEPRISGPFPFPFSAFSPFQPPGSDAGQSILN